MTRKQKLILIIFGIVDLGVMMALAGIILRTSHAYPAPPTLTPTPLTAHTYISACEQNVLDTFAQTPVGETPAVAWDATQLYVTLKVVYPTTAPPTESVQLLWTALDNLVPPLSDGCPLPSTIIIALTAQGTLSTTSYLVQFDGEDFAAWMAGTLAEADLAAQARFRQSTQ